MDSEPTMTTTLRMPVSMNQAIKHEAIDNRRSLNSELLHRLQRTLDEDKQPDDEKAD